MKTLHVTDQPTWPAGKEPDRITDIKGGGFHDGHGRAFHVPPSIRGMDVGLAKDDAGLWRWMAADPSDCV